MESLSQWFVKMSKNGEVVVYGIFKYWGLNRFIIDPSTVIIYEDGFSFEEEKKNRVYKCDIKDFDGKHCITSSEERIRGKELKPSVAYFIYDLISAIQSQKLPILQKSFSLEELKEKYAEYLGEYKDLHFNEWVAGISFFGYR